MTTKKTTKKESSKKAAPKPAGLSQDQVNLRDQFAMSFIESNFPISNPGDMKDRFKAHAIDSFDFAASMMKERARRGIGL